MISPSFQCDITSYSTWYHFAVQTRWYHFEKLGDITYLSRWYHFESYVISPSFSKWYHLLSQLCDITLIIKWYHLVQLVIPLSSKVISHIIKWSGILANFAYSWLAETCFPRPYLRVSTPQMLNDGLFGVSVMSQRKRRFTRQFFAQTGEFGVHFLMTSQYTHVISRRFCLWLTTPWTFLCVWSQFHVKFPII